MARKNQNQSRPAARSAKRAAPKATRKVARSRVPRRTVSTVCGLTDPFCVHAEGAKFPDDSSVRTLAFSMRATTSITTDTAGNGGFLFAPDWRTQSTFPLLPAGGGWTPTGNSYVPVLAGSSMYRIVSAGFRFRRTTSPMNSPGMVYCRVGPQMDDLSSYAAGFFPEAFNGQPYEMVALSDAKDVCAICPRSDQPPQDFYPIDTAAAWKQDGVVPVYIAVLGGPPDTLVGVAETVIHYEFTFSLGTALAQASTPPPQPSPAVLASTKMVRSRVPPISKSTEVFARNVVNLATSAVGAYFGPTAGMLTGGVANLLLGNGPMEVD